MTTKPTPTADNQPALDDEPVDAEVVGSELAPTNGAADLAIPTNDDGAVTALISADPEWSDVDDGDLSPGVFRIPHLSVNRNLDGGFVNPETGEKSTTLEFVWLAKGTSRAWFKDPFGTGESTPACRSFDGVKADPNSPDLQNGGDCASCPRAVWKDGQSPECNSAIEALVFVPDNLGTGRLVRLRWGGLAVRPAREFWQSFQTRMPKRPPIAYVSRVELESTDTKGGKKYVPRFERVRELTRGAAQPLIDERERALADWQADVAEAVVNTSAAEHDDEGLANGTDVPGASSGGAGGAAPGVEYGPDEEPFVTGLMLQGEL